MCSACVCVCVCGVWKFQHKIRANRIVTRWIDVCSLPSIIQEFLNDYGMMWVGSGGEQGRRGEEEERTSREQGLWIPNSSLAGAPYFQVDFDLILKNVKVTVPTSSLYHCSITTVSTHPHTTTSQRRS